MPASPTDLELVARCLTGEEAAWSLLVSRYADLVHGIARGAGLPEDQAGDVVQEVGVLLWKGLRRLRNHERLFPWIVRTARREAWRQKRRGRAVEKREARRARSESDPGPLPADALRALEDEQAVREALAALQETCRRILRALYFEENPGGYDEVAERLGIPRGSIGPTRGRCLDRLREELTHRGFGPDVSDAGGSASKKGKRP